MDAIILAGGRGTRISHIIGDTSKPMIKFADKPFLDILASVLFAKGIENIILSVGSFSKQIIDYFSEKNDDRIHIAVENTMLGTGGGVYKTLKEFGLNENILVVNGDSYNHFDLDILKDYHEISDNDITILAKKVSDNARYGTLVIDESRVTAFKEKMGDGEGIINTGVYIINPRVFRRFQLPETFSLETDFLSKYVKDIKIGAILSEGYFIDFGVPSDLELALRELPQVIDKYEKSVIS